MLYDSKLRTPIFHKNHLFPAEHLNCTVVIHAYCDGPCCFECGESCRPMIADCRARYCLFSGIYFDTNGLIWHSILYFGGITDSTERPIPLFTLLFSEDIITQEAIYPLVNCYITMENHHVQWENPLFLWPWLSYFDITRG